MKAKTILAITISLFIILFSSSCFATTNMLNDVGNGMKNAADTVGNGVKNVVNGAGNMVDGATSGRNKGMNNAENGIEGMTSDTNNYTANKTSATTNNDATFLGMNSTAWAWLIMAVFGAIIVGMVIFYGKQKNDSYNKNNS